jgi:hypothetical protein
MFKYLMIVATRTLLYLPERGCRRKNRNAAELSGRTTNMRAKTQLLATRLGAEMAEASLR